MRAAAKDWRETDGAAENVRRAAWRRAGVRIERAAIARVYEGDARRWSFVNREVESTIHWETVAQREEDGWRRRRDEEERNKRWEEGE